MSTKLNTNKEGFYDAERIVGYRYNITFGRDEYLIKWDGYPDEECTWQPIEDLNYCRRLLKDFLRDELRPRAGDPNLPIPDSDSESELIDLPLPDEDTKEARLKRVFPNNEECGIAKGWKPNRIIGAQLEKEPYTYYIEYEGKMCKEHVNGKFMYRNCPKMVEMFHEEIGVPNPYKMDHRRQEGERGSDHRSSLSYKGRSSTSKRRRRIV